MVINVDDDIDPSLTPQEFCNKHLSVALDSALSIYQSQTKPMTTDVANAFCGGFLTAMKYVYSGLAADFEVITPQCNTNLPTEKDQ